VYLQSDDKDRILLCNCVEDLTGATINISDEIGKVSGDLIKEADLDELQNNLFFELKTKNLNGEENEYHVQLILTKI
jgi:hypothetical protein